MEALEYLGDYVEDSTHGMGCSLTEDDMVDCKAK